MAALGPMEALGEILGSIEGSSCGDHKILFSDPTLDILFEYITIIPEELNILKTGAINAMVNKMAAISLEPTYAMQSSSSSALASSSSSNHDYGSSSAFVPARKRKTHTDDIADVYKKQRTHRIIGKAQLLALPKLRFKGIKRKKPG